MKRTEVVVARGHELIRSTHKVTFEITRDEKLTERGDCIIAVSADKGAADLSDDFKEAAKRTDARITVTIEVSGLKETVKALGDPGLFFMSPQDMVVRKSGYVCERTIAVKANKAARDLSRSLIEKLKNSKQEVKITITVEVPDKENCAEKLCN